MTESEEQSPGSDDTAAFQRFYTTGPVEQPPDRGLVYRLFVGWWRDRP